MTRRIKGIFSKFSIVLTTDKNRKILSILILGLLSILSFAIPSFSALPIFNYVVIGLVCLLCFLILFYKIVFNKIIIDSYVILVVLFNILLVISMIINPDSQFITTYFTLSFMSICLYEIFLEKNIRKFAPHVFLTGLLIFAFYFMFSYRNEILNLSNQRIGDKFDNLNTVGYYFVYAFVISLFFVSHKKPFTYFILLISLLFVFLAFRTGSRSALLVCGIIFLIFPFYDFRHKKILIPILIDVGLVLLLILGCFLAKKVFGISILSRFGDFFKSLSGESIDYSSNNRIELAFQSFYLFLKRPITGWGNNVFSIYSSERLFAHNNITELLCDFGIFVFVLFESLIAIPFMRIIKNRAKREEEFVSLLLLLALFVVQFFYVNSQLKFDWILISFVYSVSRDSKKDHENKLNVMMELNI